MFEKVIDHLLLSLWSDSSVELDFALPVTERAITGVCGVGHFWMFFVGEKIREIGFERAVGAAKSPVCVLPFVGVEIGGFFYEEVFPAFVPRREFFCEEAAVHLCELESEGAKLLRGIRDGFARDVLLDHLDLMKLAQLDWNFREATFKHCNNTLASIDHKT